MKMEPSESNKNLFEKSEKKDEFINVFNYFENANIRNREAFAELLDYSMKNRRES